MCHIFAFQRAADCFQSKVEKALQGALTKGKLAHILQWNVSSFGKHKRWNVTKYIFLALFLGHFYKNNDRRKNHDTTLE